MNWMMTKTILAGCLWVCVLPRVCVCFSRGASLSSCVDMKPGHVRAQPLHTHSPSATAIHVSRAVYLPQHTLTVTVRSSRAFMGFLLQARSVQQDRVLGSFLLQPPATQPLSCQHGADTVTHSDKLLKRILTFSWRAPAEPSGDLRFFITVVQSYFVYWARIRSVVVHDGSQRPLRTGNYTGQQMENITASPLEWPRTNPVIHSRLNTRARSQTLLYHSTHTAPHTPSQTEQHRYTESFLGTQANSNSDLRTSANSLLSQNTLNATHANADFSTQKPSRTVSLQVRHTVKHTTSHSIKTFHTSGHTMSFSNPDTPTQNKLYSATLINTHTTPHSRAYTHPPIPPDTSNHVSQHSRPHTHIPTLSSMRTQVRNITYTPTNTRADTPIFSHIPTLFNYFNAHAGIESHTTESIHTKGSSHTHPNLPSLHTHTHTHIPASALHTTWLTASTLTSSDSQPDVSLNEDSLSIPGTNPSPTPLSPIADLPLTSPSPPSTPLWSPTPHMPPITHSISASSPHTLHLAGSPPSSPSPPSSAHPDPSPVPRRALSDALRPPQPTAGWGSRIQGGRIAANASARDEPQRPRLASEAPEPKREKPEHVPRQSASELGMLLLLAAGVGMSVAVGLRYVRRGYCRKHTAMSLGDHNHGDRGIIYVQECGDLVQVRKIRQNSLLLLQAECDVIASPGN